MSNFKTTIEPFIPVPRRVLDAGLSARAILCYVCLMSYTSFDKPTAFPSTETLAKRMASSVRTAQNATKELVQAGFLIVTERPGTSNFYTLTLPPVTTSANIAEGGAQILRGGCANIADEQELLINKKDTPTLPAQETAQKQKATTLKANAELVASLWFPNLTTFPKQTLGICCLLFSDRKFKGDYTACRLETPATHDEVRAFAEYAKRLPSNANIPNNMPTGASTLNKQFLTFRAEAAAHQAKQARIDQFEPMQFDHLKMLED